MSKTHQCHNYIFTFILSFGDNGMNKNIFLLKETENKAHYIICDCDFVQTKHRTFEKVKELDKN